MVNCELHASADLPPESTSHTHSVGGSVGPKSRSRRSGGERSPMLLLGIKPRYVGLTVRSLVNMPTELSRHYYPDIAVESFNSYCT